MFKCNNINQSTVTTSLAEVQHSQESQLPTFVVIFKCTIKIMVEKRRRKSSKGIA